MECPEASKDNLVLSRQRPDENLVLSPGAALKLCKVIFFLLDGGHITFDSAFFNTTVHGNFGSECILISPD